MGKINKKLQENLSIKALNIGLIIEIKKQKKIIEAKDKMISDLISGDSVKSLTNHVHSLKKRNKSLKIGFWLLFSAWLILAVERVF